MYKLKEGVELPKEFKIKVNTEQSEALQKHLLSIGVESIRHTTIGGIGYIDMPYFYCRLYQNGKNYMGADMFTGDNKVKFKRDPLPQIKFKDYFEKETSFPERFCILVTEENYKELDVYLHRNWKDYKGYSDEWIVEKNVHVDMYFYSDSIELPHIGIVYCFGLKSKDYTLITTDQFRKQFGKLVVHEVEFISDEVAKEKVLDKPNCLKSLIQNIEKLGNEEIVKSWGEIVQNARVFDIFVKDEVMKVIKSQQPNNVEDAINRHLDNDVEKEILSSKAKYYKEKSDRLRKEKFEMSISLGNFSSGVYSLTNQLNSLSKNILSKDDEIRQLKNIIAENNVTISKQKKEIEFFINDKTNLVNENHNLKVLIRDKSQTIIEQKSYIDGLLNQNRNLSNGIDRLISSNNKYLKNIKKLKNKIKWLSLR